jgi:hypothetical protein
VTALAEIISEVRGELGVGVEVLTHSTMLVYLPNINDLLPAMLVSCTITAYEAQKLLLMPLLATAEHAMEMGQPPHVG